MIPGGSGRRPHLLHGVSVRAGQGGGRLPAGDPAPAAPPRLLRQLGQQEGDQAAPADERLPTSGVGTALTHAVKQEAVVLPGAAAHRRAGQTAEFCPGQEARGTAGLLQGEPAPSHSIQLVG